MNQQQIKVVDPVFSLELPSPETLEKFAKDALITFSLFQNLKRKLSKRRTPKRDLKQLGKEIDELKSDLELVVGVLGKSQASFRKVIESQVELLTAISKGNLFEHYGKLNQNFSKVVSIVISYDKRLKALESAHNVLEVKKSKTRT